MKCIKGSNQWAYVPRGMKKIAEDKGEGSSKNYLLVYRLKEGLTDLAHNVVRSLLPALLKIQFHPAQSGKQECHHYTKWKQVSKHLTLSLNSILGDKKNPDKNKIKTLKNVG